jgi:ComF family protein
MLFPDVCRLCAVPLAGFTRIPVCSGCLQSADPFLPEFFCVQCRTPFLNAFPLDENGCCSLCRLGGTRFDAAYSAGMYDGTLRKLIHLLKYDGVLSLSGPLGDLLWKALPRTQRFDVIVPAPMHWTRRLVRGFNQAEILARDLSRRTGIPVKNDLLRKKSIPPQTGLTSHQRRQLPAGAHVLFVDDVLTTGATANACALALRRAGARQVSVVTAARADRRPAALPINTHSEEEIFVCRA